MKLEFKINKFGIITPFFRKIKLCSFAFAALFAAANALAESFVAAPDHLESPALFDNAELPLQYGQTFVAEANSMAGIVVYIDDPSRPGDPRVDSLTGPADLVLYEASNLSQPREIGRNQVVPFGETLSGLSSLLFDAPVPTVVGERYFFVLSASDNYGIGLRSQLSSTYPHGAEATLDPSTGVVTENPLGRDLSFQVLTSSLHEFSINFSSFIPGNSIEGLRQMYPHSNCKFEQLFFAGDSRGFDSSAASFRSRQLAVVIPAEALDADGLKEGSVHNLTGRSRSYNADALPVLDEADNDGILHDCRLLHDEAPASNSDMHVEVVRTGPQQVTAYLYGSAANPLIPSAIRGLFAIRWFFSVILDTSSDKPRWTLYGLDGGFPAFEIYINGTPIYTRNAPPPYSAEDIRKLMPIIGDKFVSLSGTLP